MKYDISFKNISLQISVYKFKLTIRNIYQTTFFQCNGLYCWDTIVNNKDKRNNKENMLTDYIRIC